MKPPHIEFNKNELVSPSRDELIDYIERIEYENTWLKDLNLMYQQRIAALSVDYAEIIVPALKDRIENLRDALEFYKDDNYPGENGVARDALAEDDEAKGE